jgi:beta-lactamase regulating signal transducer with metallopeptidase domain
MWMYTLLPQILNMSLTAAIVIVLVLLARLPLRKAPKIFSYVLWAVVLFRLVCPVSFSSQFSLMGLFPVPPSSASGSTYSSMSYIPPDIVHAESPQINLPIPGFNDAINNNLPQGEEQLVADPLELPMAGATILWLSGIAVMLIYSVTSLIRLRGKLIGAVRLRNNIYLADHLASPFVIGVICPKIFLPSTLPEEEQSYVILHEQTHIRRFDHIIKMLAFLALAVHWFNPLVWVAFVCCIKDMEMSCDERVLKQMGGELKGEYGASLLSLATGRRVINGSPLAFGEGNIKERIRNVMNFKKPSAWVIALSIVLVAALIIGFAANGAIDSSDPGGYKALFKERFAEARKVGLHYTATNCWGEDAVPDFSEGVTDYYKCEHYTSKAELSAATTAVFTDKFARGLFTRFEYDAFIERDGSLYITPWYLFDVSPWQAEDTITFDGQTEDTFLWDSLTVINAEDSMISYTLDWYYYYPGDPLKSVFTLVKGADGQWRFDECFGIADNMLVAYVDETLSEAEARALQSMIEQNTNVEYTDFVTREEAFESSEAQYTDKSLFENIDPSVLRHRYYVYIRDISLIEQTAEDLSHIAGIAKVSMGQTGVIPAGEPVGSSAIAASEQAQAVLDSVVSSGTVAMTLTTTEGVGGGRYEVPADAGNGPNRVIHFDGSFNWSYAESGVSSPPESVSSLKVESPDGTASIECWQDSNLVLCTLDGESFRLSTGVPDSESDYDGAIFAYLRFWYDEAEISGLRGDIIIPDKGQSYGEIAQAWTDAFEGAMLRATPGSKFACIYLTATAFTDEEAMDSWYPESLLEKERFYFSYSTIFVPENELAKSWLIAGNTIDYEGDDAPDGAMEYFRMGPMYLTEEGWRCDGTGTAP